MAITVAKPKKLRRKDKRGLYIDKIRNNEFLECLMSMFNTSNNKNYNLRSNELDFARA
jgi:hypothetical protein